MEVASFRIWAHVTEFASNDDKRHAYEEIEFRRYFQSISCNIWLKCFYDIGKLDGGIKKKT